MCSVIGSSGLRRNSGATSGADPPDYDLAPHNIS